jgi:chromosome segregation ATPase
MGKLLESAEQTLNYWREQYDRFQEKKQLLAKRRFLERELAWAEVVRREQAITELEANRKKEQDILGQIEIEATTAGESLQAQRNELEKLRLESKTFFEDRLSLEREKATNESTITLCEQFLEEISIMETTAQIGSSQSGQTVPSSKGNLLQFRLLKSENLKLSIENSRQQLSKLNRAIDASQLKMRNSEEEVEKVNNQAMDIRIRMALLQYRRENAITNIEALERELKDAKEHLDEVVEKAEQTGAICFLLVLPFLDLFTALVFIDILERKVDMVLGRIHVQHFTYYLLSFPHMVTNVFYPA